MTADDLSNPVHRKRRSILEQIRGAVTAPRLVVGLTALLGLLAVGWLWLASDPLGGEPVVVIALDSPSPSGGGTAGDIGIRESVGERGKGTRIEQAPEPEKITEKAETAEPAETGGLVHAPVRGLSERGPDGILPRIASDGRRPAEVYARPLRLTPGLARAKGRIAILIGGMGLSSAGTSEAITKLPEEVTLAFAPYVKGLDRWIERARRNGHEVMLQVPMEPFDYPDNDPGPYTLLIELASKDNLRRLDWLLSRFSGYTGVVNYMGAKFTAAPGPLRSVLAQFKKRGLLFLDDGSSPRTRTKATARSVGLDAAVGALVIDVVQSSDAIDNALKRLETIALRDGQVIATGSGLPITVEQISDWAETLEEKGLVLVPVSALIMAKNKRTAGRDNQ